MVPYTDMLMSARTLLPKGDDRLSQPWRDDQMRDDENSVYEAECCSADHMASSQGRANTCPGNAPVQLSLAAGLVQGGERSHCKVTTRVASSAAETAQGRAERMGTAPGLERREGRASGGQGRHTGLPALQTACTAFGRSVLASCWHMDIFTSTIYGHIRPRA